MWSKFDNVTPSIENSFWLSNVSQDEAYIQLYYYKSEDPFLKKTNTTKIWFSPHVQSFVV